MIRAGIGYDLHRLAAGRALILGGVHIPFDEGLEGHSDADALVHAVIDALLGGAGLGNIGQHFPASSAAYKDADSLDLLSKTASLLSEKGYKIINIDANLVVQRPVLNPYLQQMQENLAHTLGIRCGQVSVKAKTNEGLGPEGRGEAISAQAVAAIEI